ncbi:putative transposon, En/Spm-like protein [Tanacetum coccineum]
MTGEQIYNEVQHIENKWGKGKRTNNKASENQEDMRGRGGKIQKQKRNTTEEEGSSSQVNGQNGAYWKKFNIWYRKLRYWRHNSVPHCIDFMHVEKNVAESLVGTLLHVPRKTKDEVNARLDLAELGVKPELFVMQEEDKTTLPLAGYTLMNAEKHTFCETLHNIRANLKDMKLIGLKSHEYRMLMQEFLPIAIRSIMHPPTRYAIIRFCFFFKSICSKEIILQELDKMQAELVVTLCLLEKFFPLSFFDIMIHLTVHLTREVKLCGPICFRWMYPFERCMKVIKEHVQNRNKPEGCIAEETIAEETIEFFSEYHISMKTIDEIVPYIERHKQVLKTENPGKRIAFLENEHSKSFAKWLRKEVDRDLTISKESVSETVNHRAGGVKRYNLGYTLVDLNNLGHKVDPFILASQARQVFYVKDQIDKKLSIVFKTPPKNYKDTYDEVNEEFSIVIHQRNDNILPCVNRRDLGNESRDDYYRTDCGGVVILKSK